MKELTRIGHFQVLPIEWLVRKAQSGAVGIEVVFKVLAQWDENEGWHDWAQYIEKTGEYEVSGTWWVIKRTGELNQMAMDQIVQVLGWEGSFQKIADNRNSPPQVKCQVTVGLDEYKGTQRYRADWLNQYDAAVGGSGISNAAVKDLDARWGNLVRAAAISKKSHQEDPATPTEPTPPKAEEIGVSDKEPEPEGVCAMFNSRRKQLLAANPSDEDKRILIGAALEAGLIYDKKRKRFVTPDDKLPF